jgi:hypothetical protein
MLDPHREIQALVDSFVADLSELAKRIAIEQLKTAFGVGVKLAPKSALKLPPPAPPARRASRARRRQHEIEALRDKLRAAIAAHPGLRAEDINAALGTKTAQIAQPLRRLVADRLVRTEGARRGTRYFIAAPADVQNGRRSSEPAASVEEAPAPA